MRKLFFIISIALICCVSAVAQSTSISLQSASKQECYNNSFKGFNAAFSFNEINATPMPTEKGTFTAISINGAYPTGNEGSPQLPAFHELIAVPQGATLKVIVKSYSETEYSLNSLQWNKIYPNQPSLRKDIKPEDAKFFYNVAAYEAKGYEQREIATASELGTLRNMRIAELSVNPVIYDASSNSIKVRNNIEIEVVFENGDKSATQSLYENTYSPYFVPVYKQMFNANSVYDDHPDLYSTPVHMLVVANRMFETALQPWILWKTQKGFYMDVHYTDEPAVGTTYTAIRTFITNKYNDGVANGTTPSFLVLVGDVPQIPNTMGNQSQMVTDLYYSSVDGDMFPEMYCSRMSCETVTELNNLIEKTLVYEKTTMADPSYLANVLLIAGADSYWNPKLAQPTINYGTINYFNTAHNYNNVYAYLNSYSGCYNNLNTGVGFANYTAHGSETSWADPSFSVSNANALTNYDKYFFAIGNCCLAGNFGRNGGPCLAEAMIRGYQKGAFAYIGSCPNTYWYEDYYWSVGATNMINGTPPTPAQSSVGAYDAAHQEDQFNTVNSAMFIGNIAVSYAHDNSYQTSVSALYYWQAYHTFGDGSVMPYFGMPTNNTVSHMAIVPIGVAFYEVSADPGSYVAVSKDGVLYGAAQVGVTGTVMVPLNPPITSGGDVDIVVTHPKRFPYITTRVAAALEGPYLVTDSYSLDGDGILSYGETTGMLITLKNVGGDPSTSPANVTLSSTDGLATIINGTVQYPALAVGETSTKSGYQFSVSADVTNGQNVLFSASIVSGAGSWNSNISMKVYKPVLEYQNVSWKGSFEPGDNFNVIVNYKNTGGFTLNNATATLSCQSQYVTINVSNYTMGSIAPNGSGIAVFNITLANNTPTNEAIAFTTNASGDNGLITTQGEFTISNSCNVIFELSDSYGDGWNGASLTVSFDNGTPSVTYGMTSGSFIAYTKEIFTGTNVTINFTGGSWNSECSFAVKYEDGTLIYQSAMGLNPGLITSFLCNCGITLIDPCEPVTNLTANEENLTVTLTWNASAASSYTISKDGVVIDEVTTASYTDSNVTPGVYTYCVTAKYSDGCVSLPECVSVGVSVLCLPPENITYTTANNSVILYWDTPSTSLVTGYNIYRDGAIIATNVSANEYTDSNVIDGTVYHYEISAIYSFCESEPVEQFVNYLGIGNSSNSLIYLFPNPASSTIRINGADAISEVRVFNNVGQLVAKYENTNLIDVSSLHNGVYFIVVMGFSQTLKAVIYR